ncbi:protein HEADING DATE REPRESSOR 1 isoform X2 [Diospyros lotus]|uniref:protein HEADING DATE REPRESSOR 1 isoform X2 n=1 Tax=Diospyros lotus TaxID=55363 RepID=UPI00225A9586|nr:protein HEADING DATE REPRESSOR 1 isoform X2 [Diospyros lotus]
MGTAEKKGTLDGFSPLSTTPVFWKSRKRSAPVAASSQKMDETTNDTTDDVKLEKDEEKNEDSAKQEGGSPNTGEMQDPAIASVLSEKRKALFEPLDPITNVNGKRPSAESLLPPPDFESAIYPRGWLIGKKRKLVNVDVVESMRRIAVQEMNRKDREINGLNEQLEEDARCLERLQLQLLEERSKRTNAERENAMLQNQIDILMNMLQEQEAMDDEEPREEEEP